MPVQSEMKGWYEIRDNDFLIWEGILAIYPPKNLSIIQLFKIMSGEIFEIHVELEENQKNLNVKSDGYWQCSEIQGVLSSEKCFLCHSTGVEHAFQILKVLPSAITSISIRFDPNPLRNWEKEKIEERIKHWGHLAKQFCEFPENSKIILDSNMLN